MTFRKLFCLCCITFCFSGFLYAQTEATEPAQTTPTQTENIEQTFSTKQADQIETTVDKKKFSQTNLFGPILLHNDFYVFPKNKRGNTIYKGNTKLFSFPNLILRDVKAIQNNYIYYLLNEKNQPELRFQGESDFNFTKLGNNFYQLSNTREYTLMLFRISPSQQIQNLLPKSKSAQGLITNSQGKSVFFNILTAKIVTIDNKKTYVYRIQLHIVYNNKENVTTLPITIDTMKLKINWNRNNSISYQDLNNKTAIFELP